MRVAELTADGPKLLNERDALDAIAAASEYRADLVVGSVGRLGVDLFRPRTRTAVEIIQKFLTYQLRLVIVGDISAHLHERSALRDSVYESNSSTHVWLVSDLGELSERLAPKPNTP